MEYCSDGDLFSLVKKGYLKDEARTTDRYCLFKQLVQGINYLHSHGVAHRDIKLENLLVTDRCKLKLTDFGISEVFSGIHPGLREAGGQCGTGMEDDEVRWSKGRCGSQPYMAPEVLLKSAPDASDTDNRYDPRAIDVWSSAIIMIYLTFGGGMWEIADESQRWYRELVAAWAKCDAKRAAAREKMLAGATTDKSSDSDTSAGAVDVAPESMFPNFEPLKRHIKSLTLRRLLLQMLHPDPQQRISIAEVAATRWLRNADCCQPESFEEPRPFDASKLGRVPTKVCCHDHLPPASHSMTMPSLGKMPGHVGY
jgi:serine/threonine protein kinase